MYIVVGLGNVGSRYDNTYHNLGFMVVDKLAKDLGVTFSKHSCKSSLAEGRGKDKFILVKPETYMNNSGEALVLLKKKYKEAKFLVVVDDIDLPAGKVRYRERGSSGTHNGLRSIVSYIGEDFERIKLGTGRDESLDLADFVLSKIKDKTTFDKAIEEATKMIMEKL